MTRHGKRRSRLSKKRSGKAGLPPGTLVHIGERKTERPRITVMDYDEGGARTRETESAEACHVYRDKPNTTWININGIHKIELVDELGRCFGLHPLLMEDVLDTGQRPKMEDYEDHLFLVLKVLVYDEEHGEVLGDQVSLVLGPNYVISFQEGENDLFEPVRERIRTGKGRIRKMGADYLVYSLVDAVVDSYFVVLERIGERIETLEDEMVTAPTPDTLSAIHSLKREMIFLRRSVWPLRELLGSLERGETALIREPTQIYLRDVYDNTIQVMETIETYRDVLSGMLDIYLSSISNRLSQVMKVLTIISTIFIPLTFIAGVYGMNFKHMPELEWPWGYPAILTFMGVAAASMLACFRRKKWL
jgi:magnesium transporter